MMGTPLNGVSMPASRAELLADPRAVPKASPRAETMTGLRTTKFAVPCEWMSAMPPSVTVRELTAPLTCSSQRISLLLGTNPTPSDCSTVFVPRTARPRTKSSIRPDVIVFSGSTRVMKSR
jgi:hypothetical protein